MKKIKVGYDAKRIVRNATGLGSYGRTLINSLSSIPGNELDMYLYAPDEGREELREQINLNENIRFVYPEHAKGKLKKDLWRTHGMVKDLLRDGIQLYHGLSGELPSGLRKTGIKGLVTIHDLIFMRHPEFYHYIDTKLYAHKFRTTCLEAERIVAISECTKRDIMYYGGVEETMIDVIYQSCSTRFKVQLTPEMKSEVAHKYALPARYILNVGTIEERKNVLLAVKALPLLPEDVKLVIVGRPTKYAETVMKYIRRNGLESRVVFLHGISDAEMPAIYQQAEAFVYPSRYEGFGIPIIEAIQSQLPVVACMGSCLEEAGGEDNLYVSPDDADGMAAALRQMLRGAEGREQRIERSMDYIRRFENNDIAKQMADVYRGMMEQ
jgi:glycosyltransferase involved in cell wall biosynthesis